MSKANIWIIVAALSLSLDLRGAISAQDPVLGTTKGISYAAGGIGDAAQTKMKQIAADYSLRLTFAREKTGAYLADVRVRIEDRGGNLLVEQLAPGPLFFAKLPAGR